MATTYTGRLITPWNFTVPAPLDLAVQLGRLPRFVGATRQWWSVLHHIYAMYLISETVHPPSIAYHLRLHILLHEADEVACGDIPTTWKHPDQRALTKPFFERVWRAYAGDKVYMGASVKELDTLSLRAEMSVLGPPNVLEHSGLAWGGERRGAVDTAQRVVMEAAERLADPLCSINPDGWLVNWFIRALGECVTGEALRGIVNPIVQQGGEPGFAFGPDRRNKEEDTVPA